MSASVDISESSLPQPGAKDTAILCPSDLDHFKLNKHGKVKVPRRLIHCSDGILEEYSTDEDEEEEELPPVPVDTSKMTWGPYFWYYTVKTATGGLAVCDYLGEKLAYFFGITSPKYQYAISEWERQQEEEREEQELEEQERAAEEEIIRGAMRASEPRIATLEIGGARVETISPENQHRSAIVVPEDG